MEDFNNDLNEKHNYEVYSDKASKLLTFSIVFLVISLISYIIALLAWDTFDFGFIFELVALISIVVSKNALIDKKLSLSKKTIIASMCSLGWLLVYDFIDFFVNINKTLHFFPNVVFSFGALRGNRTPGLSLRRGALYPTEL